MCRIQFSVLLLVPACFVLTCASALAHVQPAPDSQQPSQQSSSGTSAPSAGNAQQQPPAPQPQSMSEANSRIQRSAEDLLHGDPQLSNADVEVSVDDHAITLTGTVHSYTQHQRVMALMHQYSRYRQIVDKLQAK
jgi:BON domain